MFTGLIALLAIVIPAYTRYNDALLVMHGASNGVMHAAFWVLAFSWYTPRQLFVKLVICTLISAIVSLIFGNFYRGERSTILQRLVVGASASLYINTSMVTFQCVGTPSQIRWMGSYEREKAAAISTTRTNIPSEANPVWRIMENKV